MSDSQRHADMQRSTGLVALTLLILAACGTDGGPSASPARTGALELTLLAGPVCPVESAPPDPNCAPRPIAGRVILLLAGDGREVARGTSGDDGRLTFRAPPAAYIVRAVPSDGFPTAPADQTVTLDAGESTALMLAFDTGIR